MPIDEETWLKAKVVSDEEAEKADCVVCLRLIRETQATFELFDDNVTGTCSLCRHAIFFRHYAPKRPPKICHVCAADGTIARDAETQRMSHSAEDLEKARVGRKKN